MRTRFVEAGPDAEPIGRVMLRLHAERDEARALENAIRAAGASAEMIAALSVHDWKDLRRASRCVFWSVTASALCSVNAKAARFAGRFA